MDESSSDYKALRPQDLDDAMQNNLREFHDLLGSIGNVETKQKALWRQIYEHAELDRKNAYIAFVDLYMNCHGKPDMHTVNGPILAKYLERMEKSNAQILKLAELVAAATSKKDDDDDGDISSKDIYDTIQRSKKTK